VITSDEGLSLDEQPETVVVVGAGYSTVLYFTVLY